jgi:hypothetical protein
MKTGYWIAALVVGVALVGLWHVTRPAMEARAASALPAPVSPAPSASPAAAAPAPETAPPTAADVAQWIDDTNHADASRRAAAIDALARAPREQALPVLRRLVTSGDPSTDRPRALNSLRELALDQGDADGGIRQAIREVIYHGDDEALAASAQDALDVVEEAEMK